MNRKRGSIVVAAILMVVTILATLCCGIIIGRKSLYSELENNAQSRDGRTLESVFFSLGSEKPNPYVFSKFPFGKKIGSVLEEC